MAGKQKNEFVQLGGILCAITLVVALALGAVNAVTEGPIAEQNAQKIKDSLENVMPGAESEQIDVPEGTTVTTETKNATSVTILSAYKMTKDGADAGYCVEVGPTGFGGAVDTMVGIDGDGNVTGISVISASSETPGLGARSTEPEFQAQFAGQVGTEVAVTKDGGSIDALTGATITSRAVSEGVVAAAQFAAEQG
ncbi:RnfABCDGE type electron transport complex subunit G [Butyricicoccus sp.]|uniref:RnfABCDGE type electron transport complex subunit G n=1 Tax=Butyricicoccus sp. TaxID=2049021 RepID=UPI003D7C7C83